MLLHILCPLLFLSQTSLTVYSSLALGLLSSPGIFKELLVAKFCLTLFTFTASPFLLFMVKVNQIIDVLAALPSWQEHGNRQAKHSSRKMKLSDHIFTHTWKAERNNRKMGEAVNPQSLALVTYFL